MRNKCRIRKASALIVLLVINGSARAQLTVICPTCHSELTDTLRWVQQAKDMLNSLQLLKQQYEAIAHLPDNLMGMARQLTTTPTLQNPFPQANTLSRIVGGVGMTGNAQGYMAQNRYYEPQGNDWMAQEMNRRAAGTANIQAIAMQNMQAIEERQQSLTEFYQGIEESPDIQQSAAIQARLQLEQNFIAGQQTQAQQLAVLQRAQESVDQQRIEEKQRKDVQELYDATGDNAVVAGG